MLKITDSSVWEVALSPGGYMLPVVARSQGGAVLVAQHQLELWRKAGNSQGYCSVNQAISPRFKYSVLVGTYDTEI